MLNPQAADALNASVYASIVRKRESFCFSLQSSFNFTVRIIDNVKATSSISGYEPDV